jgi:hypothetical protein
MVTVESPDQDHLIDFVSRLDEHVMEILKQGASLRQTADAFDRAFQTEGMLPLVDLTGDGIEEMIVYRFMFFTTIIGCVDGGYQRLLELDSGPGGMTVPRIAAVEDMNLNGTPDLVVTYQVTTGWNSVVDILEWNGTSFPSLIQSSHGENASTTSRLARALDWYGDYFSDNPVPIMRGGAEIDISDLDGNGTKELIISDNGPAHWVTFFSYGPWRGKTMYFGWDGLHFLHYRLEMDAPEYRFQAVQDGDRFFLLGEYDRARSAYQAAMFSEVLEWWSPERMEFFSKLFDARASGSRTPVPPEEDETEYPKLAAYAGYRLILLNAVRGDIGSAEGLYADLLKDHPHGSDGYPYVILADRFLENYRATGDPARACEQVVEYAQSAEGLLAPLGDSNHGGQSHIYEAADLCPFP